VYPGKRRGPDIIKVVVILTSPKLLVKHESKLKKHFGHPKCQNVLLQDIIFWEANGREGMLCQDEGTNQGEDKHGTKRQRLPPKIVSEECPRW
jgi:hypothetical protein